MAIYIPGMEIQKFEKGRKYEAEFTVTFDGRIDLGIVTSAFLEKPKTIEHYPGNPVPPHGRLGDLSAVAELVMQYCRDDDGICSKAGADLRELLDEIENLPTIIPAEEDET